MKEYEHSYRVIIKSSWGVWIKVTARYGALSEFDYSDYVDISEHIGVVIKCNFLLEEEKSYIYRGLSRVVEQIWAAIGSREGLVIVIDSLLFNYCDYQQEGLEAAMIEWAANAFGFAVPEIKTTFNKPENRYYFEYID